jgi:O-antigen ligase
LLLVYFRPLLEYFLSGQIFVTSQVPQTLYIVTISLAALAFLLKFSVTRLRSLMYPLLFLLAAVGVTCLSDLVAEVPFAETILPLHSLIGTWLTFVTFRFACETRRGAVAITTVLVVCATINSLVGLWGVATRRTLLNLGAEVVGSATFGYDAVTGRSGGIAGENSVGMYDLPALIAGLCLMRNRRWRPVGIALASVSSAAIVVSLSRSSILSGLAAALFFIAVGTKRTPSALWLVVILLVAVYFGAGYISEQADAPTGMAATNSTGYRFSADGLTSEARLAIWQGYFEDVMAANAFLGMGGGYISGRSSMNRMIPHNSFLDILVEYGCLGLLLYMSAFALIIKTWARCRGRSPDILPDMLFSCFCGMTVSIITLSNPLARPLWAVAGAVLGVRRWVGAKALLPLARLGNVSSVPSGYSAQVLSRAQTQLTSNSQQAG